MVGTVTNIEEKELEIIEEFSLFEDWMDKYEHIISLGKELPLIEESLKTDDLLIKGCQSKVWLHAKLEKGKVIFTADSDAIITKGIISLLIRVLSNQTPTDIINTDLTFIENIGLKEHLSPTRSNGLVSMVKQMKLYALAFRTQQNA
ncbi:MAG: SufE family protein [Flavobacteriales bacterium]|jgi:cysteine desulfuration protein SufE|nr:SufE family protein [Flavobacteriales bacterium]